MKNKTKLAILATAMMALCACGGRGDTDPSGKKVIKFFGWGSTEEKQIFQAMIAKFQEKYPEYTVSYNSTSADNFMTSLSALMRNPRQAPDVFYMPDYNFIEWINDSRRDVLLDLTPYIEKSEEFKESDVWEEGLNAYRFNKDNRKVGQGDVYGLPKDLGPNVLVYNKTMVTKNGVTIISNKDGQYGYDPTTKTLNDKVPMTWAQYVRFCKDNTKGSLSSSSSIVGVTHYPYQCAYFSNGGKFLDETNKNVTINNEKMAESLQFVADLSNKFEVMTTAEGQSVQNGIQRFASNLAASSFVGAWDTPTLWKADFDWDILYTPVPNVSGEVDPSTDAWMEGYREGCSSKSYLGSVAISVYKNSSNPDGAYKLAEFLTVNKDAQRINYMKGQAVPNLIEMANGEFQTAVLEDPKHESNGWNRPSNREVYTHMMVNSQRRPEAYTYNVEWFNEFADASNPEHNLYRIWNKDGSQQYGSHVDLWDWATKSRLNVDFLAGLEADCQAKLDPYKDKYSW